MLVFVLAVGVVFVELHIYYRCSNEVFHGHNKGTRLTPFLHLVPKSKCGNLTKLVYNRLAFIFLTSTLRWKTNKAF